MQQQQQQQLIAFMRICVPFFMVAPPSYTFSHISQTKIFHHQKSKFQN